MSPAATNRLSNHSEAQLIQSARFPNPETTVAMDAQHQHPNKDPTPEPVEESSASPNARNTKPDSTRRRLEHPIQAILGAVVVLLLGFALTQTNDRISRLEDKIDERFARVDERFARLEDKVDEINLKLTALIAALNSAAETEAALEGRLLEPDTTADNPANQSPAP